jgi:hypothetical protein
MGRQVAPKHYLAEGFTPDADSSRFSRDCDRIRAATGELAAEGAEVSYVDSLLAPREETTFHLFEARSAADVERALTAAGVDADRVSVVMAPAGSILRIASHECETRRLATPVPRAKELVGGRSEGDENDA